MLNNVNSKMILPDAENHCALNSDQMSQSGQGISRSSGRGRGRGRGRGKGGPVFGSGAGAYFTEVTWHFYCFLDRLHKLTGV